MIVVSDTSPISALLKVGQADLLPRLFHRVLIPQAVAHELKRRHDLPHWAEVRSVSSSFQNVPGLQGLDAGESEAIGLALEVKADQLLIDERRGRRVAEQNNINVIGVLGIVLLAKQNGLIDSARGLLEPLDLEAGIYLSDEVREAALRRIGE